MTSAAWLMLAATWAVVVFFAGRFFLMILKMPLSPDREARTRDGILEKDA